MLQELLQLNLRFINGEQKIYRKFTEIEELNSERMMQKVLYLICFCDVLLEKTVLLCFLCPWVLSYQYFTTLNMTGRLTVIHQYFPVRDLSFLPCDRTFAIIKYCAVMIGYIHLSNMMNTFRTLRKSNRVCKWSVTNQQILNFKICDRATLGESQKEFQILKIFRY